MKVVVIAVSPWKEIDAVITAACSEGKLSFRAYGVKKNTSKNFIMNTPLTVADICFTNQKQSMQVLKEASLISSPFVVSPDFDYLNVCNSISQIARLVVEDRDYPDLYGDLINVIEALKEEDPFYCLLAFVATVSMKSGLSLQINQCIRCGTKKNIVAFSFEEGGYICGNCFGAEEKSDLTGESRRLIHDVYAHLDYDFSSMKYSYETKRDVIIKFLEYINGSLGTDIDINLFKQ